MFGPKHLPVIMLATALAVGACGGEDPAPNPPRVTDPTSAAPDDSALVQERWDEYWQVRIASENAGAIEADRFAEVARSKAVEEHKRRIRNYGKNKLVRVGEPQFRDVEVRLSDTSATVLACFNADEWTAKIDGEPWSAKKYGWEVTGSVMKQIDGTWFVVDELATADVADMGKTC